MDEIYKEIVNFQHKCRDYTDDKSSNTARTLEQEVQRLEDEAQVKRNPRSLEDRVKSVVHILEQAAEEEVMTSAHADELIDRCEDFRKDLQKLF